MEHAWSFSGWLVLLDRSLGQLSLVYWCSHKDLVVLLSVLLLLLNGEFETLPVTCRGWYSVEIAWTWRGMSTDNSHKRCAFLPEPDITRGLWSRKNQCYWNYVYTNFGGDKIICIILENSKINPEEREGCLHSPFLQNNHLQPSSKYLFLYVLLYICINSEVWITLQW